MRVHSRLLLLALLSGCMQAPVTPPATLTSFYDGPDPYLWLESPKKDHRVNAWLAQQAAKTRAWQQQQPSYPQVREQLQLAWDHPKWMVADIKRDQVFFYFNPGLDDHYSLYQQPLADFMAERETVGAPGDTATLLINGTWFTDNTSPGDISISPDAGWLAYQVNQHTPSGGLESRWLLRSLTSVSRRPVVLEVNHNGWTLWAEQLVWGQETGSVFFTVSVPLRAELSEPAQAGRYQQEPGAADIWQSRVYAYRAGAAISTSELVYIEPDGRHIGQLHVLENRQSPAHGAERGQSILMAVKDDSLPDTPASWRVFEPGPLSGTGLARGRDVALDPSTHGDRRLAQYVGSIRGSPAFLTTGARGTGAITWVEEQQSRVLIAETEAPLRSALVVGDRLVLEYLVHGSSTLRVFDHDGRPLGDGNPVLPAPVRVEALRATEGQQLLIYYSGMVTPPVSELIDLHSRRQTRLRQNRPALAVGDLRARLIRVSADDESRIPVWVAGPAQTSRNAADVLLLEVYGGFAAPMETSFSISRLAWLASGGAFAVAGPRGGGDYGEPWHHAGRGERRHNSISDVLTVADWLRSEWLAETGQLVISGRSHGGLLATEAVQKTPGLFSALVTDAAVLDLVRLDALGGAGFWQEEYQGFTSSPYHTLLSGSGELSGHPPALLITRENDPVVAPAHSFKYVQALQAIPDRAPAGALLSVVPGSGHDSSGSVSELIDDYALRWVFLRSHLPSGLSPD